MEEAKVEISPVFHSLRQLITAMESVVKQETVVGRGQPRISIEKDQISYLVENGFRVKDIADIFHCSKRTIERRINDLSIKVTNFTSISDVDLDSCVSSVLSVLSVLLGDLLNENESSSSSRLLGIPNRNP